MIRSTLTLSLVKQALTTMVRDAVEPQVNFDGIKESDHEEMCNILNDYFGTVFTEESIVG
jgi:hypothetical protein